MGWAQRTDAEATQNFCVIGGKVRESRRCVHDSNKEGPAQLGPVARISEGQGFCTAVAGSGRAVNTPASCVGRKRPPIGKAA